jgi:hypothetical protein
VNQRICLRGTNGEYEGKKWESESILRVGRLANLDVVLGDSSVSRRHGEVYWNDQGWQVRDLGSTNGTFLNGVKLGGSEKPLRSRDIVQFGKIAFAVELLPPNVHKHPGPIIQPGDYRLSGPLTHANLTIYLVRGTDQPFGAGYLTLQEAQDQQKAIVHETGTVNELSVQNQSPEQAIFIQSGDLVKGGRQDRVLHYDFVVPPQSGKVPLASFCVEQGRWSQRGSERVNEFGSSHSSIPPSALKPFTNYEVNQSKVWDRVAAMQNKLTAKLGSDVKSIESSSSWSLTLENNDLQQAVEPYLDAMTPAIADHEDVIGIVFIINCQFNSAEVYGSSHLFRKLAPKLLKAIVVEAITEQCETEAVPSPCEEEVRAWLADAESGRAYQRQVGERIETVTQEGKRCLLFETRDRQHPGTWLHRTYLSK